MDQERFDTLTRKLATGTSRRTLLGLLTGGFAVAFGGGRTALAQGNAGGNSACVALCTEMFPPGKEQGQCIAAGARGEGPCVADACAGVICTPSSECVDSSCDGGSCIETVKATGTLCSGGTCDSAGTCKPIDACTGVDCQSGLGDNDCTTSECIVVEVYGVPTGLCYNDIHELDGEPCLQGGPGTCGSGICFH